MKNGPSEYDAKRDGNGDRDGASEVDPEPEIGIAPQEKKKE